MEIAHACAEVIAKIFPNIMSFVDEG